MPAALTHEEFSKHLNTTFEVPINEELTLNLELIEVSEYLVSEHQERYSVFFRGPEDKILQQGTRTLVHPAMGEFQLFLVPIGQKDGIRYEAVFNHLVSR